MNSVQKTRLAKAVRELKSSPGWQEIKRFILAESGSEEPDMDGVVNEIQSLLVSAVMEERQWALDKRR